MHLCLELFQILFRFVPDRNNSMICPLAHIEEVFSTPHGAVYQCSRQNCYWLEFQGNTTAFRISDFFMFKKRVDSVDIADMLSDTARTADFEIIMPFRSERCFILSVQDILRLRDILSGAKFMIQLNSEVKKCLQKGAMFAV